MVVIYNLLSNTRVLERIDRKGQVLFTRTELPLGVPFENIIKDVNVTDNTDV